MKRTEKNVRDPSDPSDSKVGEGVRVLHLEGAMVDQRDIPKRTAAHIPLVPLEGRQRK